MAYSLARLGFACMSLHLATCAASADEPRGLRLRLYSFDGGVAAVPDIAPGQSPSEMSVIATVDLRNGQFGTLKENFAAEIDGSIQIDVAGEYGLRLSSDDGSLLFVDGAAVVDNDGPHGFTPKDAVISLNPGPHALRVRYYQGGGDAALKLEWKPPGASVYAVIPSAAFLPVPPANGTAEPGKKKIIAPLRRGKPGDGSPLAGIHPAFKTESGKIELDAGLVYERGFIRSALDGGPSVAAWVPNLNRALDGKPAMRLPTPFEGHYQAPAGGELMRVGFDAVGATRQGFAVRLSKGAAPMAASGNASVFEIRSVRVLSNGLEIRFTAPLDPRCGWDTDALTVEQWPLAVDGSAVCRDGGTYAANSCTVSDDRTTVFVELEGLKSKHIVYVRLLAPWVSEAGASLWATEAWYTLLNLPPERRGASRPRPAQPAQNVLTDAEKAEGWQLLFDGKSTAGWHNFKKKGVSAGWQAIDGCLVMTGGGGDIATDEEFGDFELTLEWRICPAGNSGIFYRVGEAEPNRWVFETGPEMQVLDNSEHADGRNPLTSAGSNYALHAPPRDVTRAIGFFNQGRIVVKGEHVEHWLNGEKLVSYELQSDAWKKLVEASKFKSMPRYGTVKTGRIALQDHGDRVWYRNIKIRKL